MPETATACHAPVHHEPLCAPEAVRGTVLLIDNYDSFVYNLVQTILPLGFRCLVHRNDQVTLDAIEAAHPTHLIVSPGPCTPDEAGISCAVIERFGGAIPLLGVCLGHQCLGQVFGGTVGRTEPVHGKTSWLGHDGHGIFEGLPVPFEVARYHSLVVEREGLPSALEVTAWTRDDLIMGLAHRERPHLYGVQFHPESYMTTDGPKLIANFLETRLPAASGRAR